MAQSCDPVLDRYSGLELRHLRLVWAVAEEHGLTPASERLHLTPSALSHQLRQVESLVGAPLFRRERKAMRLTGAGEIVFELATRALSAVADVEDRLARLRDGAAGTVRVSTHCYTGYHWLPAVMRAFRADHPEADVRIVGEATTRPIEALLEREIDVAITTEVPTSSLLRTRPVLSDEIVLLVPPSHRLAGRARIEARDVADEHLILYASTPDQSAFCVDVLRPAGIRPRRYTSIQLTEGILEMVKAGLGVTALAEWSARPEVERGNLRAIRIGRRGFKRTWNAVTRAEDDQNGVISGFVCHLAANLAPRR